MRIAIIVTRLSDLGPIKVMQTLKNVLTGKDNLTLDVYYISKTDGQELSFAEHARKLSSTSFDFESYDLVHTSGIRPDFFAFINRRKIKYHISTIHNFVFEDLRYTYNRTYSWFFGVIWLIIWSRADKLVCVSSQLKTYYSRWYTTSKLFVIHNGIPDLNGKYQPDLDVIEKIERLRSSGLKIIGFSGILTKRKGVDQLISVLKQKDEYGLAIFGDGKEYQSLKKLARKLKVENRILFFGYKSNAVNYFSYLDLIVVPSRSEGFGLVTLEAVQQSVPLICSDLPVFLELFNKEEVTFYERDNSDSLALSLGEVLATGKAKSERAYLRYQKEYTDIVMADSYYELYKSAS
jgi:L-malate glycosyltransferase